MKKLLFAFLLFVLFVLTSYQVQAVDVCTPHMIIITIGDGSASNPAVTYNTELGCVENVFENTGGYLPINTHVNFTSVPYFAIQGAITNVSGDGYIIGYQITHLINSTEVLYIVVWQTSKFMRLREDQFVVDAVE